MTRQSVRSHKTDPAVSVIDFSRHQNETKNFVWKGSQLRILDVVTPFNVVKLLTLLPEERQCDYIAIIVYCLFMT